MICVATKHRNSLKSKRGTKDATEIKTQYIPMFLLSNSEI